MGILIGILIVAFYIMLAPISYLEDLYHFTFPSTLEEIDVWTKKAMARKLGTDADTLTCGYGEIYDFQPLYPNVFGLRYWDVYCYAPAGKKLIAGWAAVGESGIAYEIFPEELPLDKYPVFSQDSGRRVFPPKRAETGSGPAS